MVMMMPGRDAELEDAWVSNGGLAEEVERCDGGAALPFPFDPTELDRASAFDEGGLSSLRLLLPFEEEASEAESMMGEWVDLEGRNSVTGEESRRVEFWRLEGSSSPLLLPLRALFARSFDRPAPLFEVLALPFSLVVPLPFTFFDFAFALGAVERAGRTRSMRQAGTHFFA